MGAKRAPRNKVQPSKGDDAVKFYDADEKVIKFDGTARTRAAKNRFLNAFIKTMAVLTPACEIAGVKSRQTVMNWKRDDAAFREIMEEIPERCLDFAETSMYSQIRDKNTAMTIFYLKTQGKKRGYVETNQVVNVNKDVTGLENMTDEELMAIINGDGE